MKLRSNTDPQWIEVVKGDFDTFLLDHASCERKASGLAMSLVCHYSDRPELVREMIDLSIEEMAHFREVMKLILARGLVLKSDEKDPYINLLRKHVRTGRDVYLLDRLLMFGIVEARGQERFSMLGEALEDPMLRAFYARLAQAEGRHWEAFLKLAQAYWEVPEVEARLDELLDAEAQIVENLPHRPAVH